jgi:hypothetical protein
LEHDTVQALALVSILPEKMCLALSFAKRLILRCRVYGKLARTSAADTHRGRRTQMSSTPMLAYPEKRKQRIAAAKARLPDRRAEAQVIYQRVEAGTNRIRRELRDGLAKIRKALQEIQEIAPGTDISRGAAIYYEKRCSDIKRLGPITDEPSDRQEEVSHETSEEIDVPGTDEVVPVIERNESPNTGPSEWRY